MNRQIVYPGAIPQDTDLLNTNKNTMMALGYLIQAVLGGSTQVVALQCSPSSPASMSVNMQPGSIYSLQQVDASAYGSLAADTSDTIMKQGIYPGGVLTMSAPAGAGQSVVYLIQAEYQDVDGGPTVLPYYNASNPSVPYSGPGNAGTPNYTVRQGKCVVALKMGTPAATGSQVAPTPDAGYTGLYAITVANGQSTITTPNIARYPLAPFIDTQLSGKLNAAGNLSDVASAPTSLANLGGAPSAGPVFSGSVINSGAAGTARFFGSDTANVARWLWGAGADAESGSNAGSSFYLAAYNDAGGGIDTPLSIPRAAGGTISTTRPFAGVSPANGDDSTLFATTAWFLAQFAANQSLGPAGYLKLPGGLIAQWGLGTTTGGGAVTVTFPITFPTAAYGPVLGLLSTSPVNAYTGYGSLTTSGMSIFTNAAGAGTQLGTVNYIIFGR